MGDRRGRCQTRKDGPPAGTISVCLIAVLFVLSAVCPALVLQGSGEVAAPRPSHAVIPKLIGGTQQAAPAAVNPYGSYKSEPAPMGIADYGIGPSGAYSYTTTEFLGTIDIVSLKTQNVTGDPWMGFQLNVILAFTQGGVQHAYWIQDVAQMDTSQNQIWFIDNIWNMSDSKGSISSSALSGNGVVDVFNGTGFYYYEPNSGPGNGVNLVYPATVSLLVTTSLNTLHQPIVTFQYDDGSGFVTYDTVTFTKANAVTTFTGFEVNGNSYNPLGLFYNAEFVLGGPGGGWSTKDVQSDVRLGLYYWNGHNYQAVPNSYNFGGNTGETISNTNSAFSYLSGSGSLIAEVQAGAGTLGPLYAANQIGTMDIQSSASSGVLYVSSATATGATPHQSSFTGGRVTVSVYPGTYLLQIYVNGALYDSGAKALAAGQTLQLQTPLGDVRIAIGYSISGGSSGFVPPTLTYVHGGVQQKATLTPTSTAYYMDPGSTWTVTSNYTTATDRWITTQPVSGIASSFQTISLAYFHQYGLTLSFTTTGTPSGAPSLTGTQFGKAFSAELGRGNGSVYYLDSGTNWSVPSLLPGSTNQERWLATEPTNGTASQATSLTFVYRHQFAVEAGVLPSQGGSVATQSGWTEAGSTIQLTQTVSPGWKFEGWTGSGSGAYSGPLNSTQIQVNAPINETATFYPGLRVTAGSNGAVTYSFGSRTGTVAAGSALTIFAPQGTTVTLRPVPSSFLYSFSGWSPQGYPASGNGTSVDLQAPASIAASFSLNMPILGGIVGGAVVVIAVVGLAVWSRRRSRS